MNFASRNLVSCCLGIAAVSAAALGATERSAAAGSERPSATRFVKLPAERTGIVAPNLYDDPQMWGKRFREFSLGAVGTGMAIGDYDGDGWPDVFAVSKTGQSRLFRNRGDFRFEDVTALAGLTRTDPAWETGATWADVNNDGRPDLYVCRFNAPNRLFLNAGDGTFREAATEWGVDIKDASVHGVFADYDRDGDLDLFLVTNILDFDISPTGRSDRLLRNDGGKFTDVTRAAGIWGVDQGHTALWFDADRDGWPDLYVANDFEGPDRFYRNNGDGTFTDVVDVRLPHTTYFSMGADFGDLDGDGNVDFLVADMRGRSTFKYLTGIEELARGIWEIERTAALTPQYMRNALYLGTGGTRYREAAWLTGLAASDWTWAVRIADLDNDGREDVFFTTGMVRNFIDADWVDRQNVAPNVEARGRVWSESPVLREANLAFRNRGGLAFEDVSATWGLDEVGVSFGAALADLDRDGDLDLVYSNFGESPSVLRNDTRDAHWLQVELRGAASNRFGIGASVEIATALGRQQRQLFPSRGIVSSDEPVVHFGLGAAERVAELVVKWPSGRVQRLTDVAADQHLQLAEPPAEATVADPKPAKSAAAATRWRESARELGLDFEHREREWDEFTPQPLLPRRLGNGGPGLAVGDANGDGRADLFVAGGAGQAGQLFLARAGGGFEPVAGPWSEVATRATALAPLWLDADGDGDRDLFVATGGLQADAGSADYQDALYLNDGRGRFTRAAAGALPDRRESEGAVAAADFDRDGRVEVFLGARFASGAWPKAGASSLWRFSGGAASDVTAEVAPGLRDAGLVTAAVWSDSDGDGWLDLWVATEWGPVKLFLNAPAASGHGRLLRDATAEAGISGLTGWWNSIFPIDVDGDGAMDYVVGNAGLNTKYRASAGEPAVLLAGDLDGSGRAAVFEAAYEGGVLRPLRGKSKMAYALPRVARRFSSFAAFANADVAQILGADRVAAAQRLTAAELRSGVLRNDGQGRFHFAPLPVAAQLAPLQGVVAVDFDGDGAADLAALQNSFAPEPSTGRFHGGLGVVLRGDGRGGFAELAPARSGIVAPRDGRALALIDADGDGAADLVAAQNQDPLLAFRGAAPDGVASTAVVLRGGGVGARVRVTHSDGRRTTWDITAGGGLLTQSEAAVFVAYPRGAPPREIEVRWPDGRATRHAWPATAGPRWVVDVAP